MNERMCCEVEPIVKKPKYKMTFTNMNKYVDFVGETTSAEEALIVIEDMLKESNLALTKFEIQDGEQE